MRPFILVTLLLLSGCMAWRPVPRASVGNANDGPQAIRLLLLDGRQLYVQNAVSIGDSLVGRVETKRVAFALTDVRRVDTRQQSADRTRTATGVAGGAATGVAIAAALAVLVALAAASVLEAVVGGS